MNNKWERDLSIWAAKEQKKINMQHRAMIIVAVLGAIAIITGLVIALERTTAHNYVLQGQELTQTLRLHPGSPELALQYAGISDKVMISEARVEGNTTYLTLEDKLMATINTVDGGYIVPFQSCTVGELLEKQGITVLDEDIVTPPLDKLMQTDTTIDITRVTYQTETERQPVKFDLVTRTSNTLLQNKQRIAQYGKEGEEELSYRLTFHNGEQVAREFVSKREVTKPKDCIIEIGTKVPETTEEKAEAEQPTVADPTTTELKPTATASQFAPVNPQTGEENLSTEGRQLVWSVPSGVTEKKDTKTITAADGTSYPYSSAISVSASAYNYIEVGGQTTATGTKTDYGTVAVDPRVIPLGSKIYIVSDGGNQSWSYGPATASDTGGLIQGNRIDMFFMTSAEAKEFGVRPAKVYILE